MRRRAGIWSSASGTTVAPEGKEGGAGRTGTPFGGSVMVIGVELGPAGLGDEDASAEGGGGAGGGAGGVDDVNCTSTLVFVGGAFEDDGGAAYSGRRRGVKNERIEDC